MVTHNSEVMEVAILGIFKDMKAANERAWGRGGGGEKPLLRSLWTVQRTNKAASGWRTGDWSFITPITRKGIQTGSGSKS